MHRTTSTPQSYHFNPSTTWSNTTNALQQKHEKIIPYYHLTAKPLGNSEMPQELASALKSAVPHQPMEQTTSRLIPNNQPQPSFNRSGPQIPKTTQLKLADQIITPRKNSGVWLVLPIEFRGKVLDRVGTDELVVGTFELDMVRVRARPVISYHVDVWLWYCLLELSILCTIYWYTLLHEYKRESMNHVPSYFILIIR